jgi:RNA polymerase sigma factor (sigma-70 family)
MRTWPVKERRGSSTEKDALDSGEQDMEHLIATHESCLLRYAIGIVGDSHAAQDVVQNVFIKLFRQWQPGMQPSASIRSWLYRVTHNEAIDHLRREKRRFFLHARQAETCTAADPPGMTEDARMEVVMGAVGRLPEAERQVVLLRLQEGLSYQEISRITGRSEGNVGCLLHHAVRKLGKWVKSPSAVQNGGDRP